MNYRKKGVARGGGTLTMSFSVQDEIRRNGAREVPSQKAY